MPSSCGCTRLTVDVDAHRVFNELRIGCISHCTSEDLVVVQIIEIELEVEAKADHWTIGCS
jgi:hypothetical protein